MYGTGTGTCYRVPVPNEAEEQESYFVNYIEPTQQSTITSLPVHMQGGHDDGEVPLPGGSTAHVHQATDVD